jgi:hypothetical protein
MKEVLGASRRPVRRRSAKYGSRAQGIRKEPMPTAPKPAKATSPERVGLRRAILEVLQALPVNRSVLHTSRNLPRSAAVGLVESGTPKGTGGADGIQSVGTLAPCYSEHTSLKQRGHLKLQLAPASSQIKTHQNSRLSLVENAGQVPSSGEIPPFGGRMPASSDLDIPKALPPTQAEPDLPGTFGPTGERVCRGKWCGEGN